MFAGPFHQKIDTEIHGASRTDRIAHLPQEMATARFVHQDAALRSAIHMRQEVHHRHVEAGLHRPSVDDREVRLSEEEEAIALCHGHDHPWAPDAILDEMRVSEGHREIFGMSQGSETGRRENRRSTGRPCL